MIYTLTLNPALDYTIESLDFNRVETNRATNEHFLPGGKGILGSIMLSNLGIKNTAFGFLGGHTGEIIKEELSLFENITCDFVSIKKATRTNVKVWDNGMTEFNVSGPVIEQSAFIELLAKLDVLTSQDLLIIAGSIPKGMSPHIYETICEVCVMKKCEFIVDTTGEKLKNTLKYKPLLIKPNQEEIEELVGKILKNRAELIKAGQELLNLGAKNVMITLGAEGAVLITHEEVYVANVPEINVVNTVGAGDSSVAGFASAYVDGQSLPDCFKRAMSCGNATASAPFIGTKEMVEESYVNILIRKHR